MALPSALSPYAKAPGIRSYAKVFRKVEKELARLEVSDLRVELLSSNDTRSALRRFFTLERADAADHTLVLEGTAKGRPLRLLAPFRRGLSLPYSLEIGLACRLPYTGSLQRTMFLRPRWELLPSCAPSRELAQQLDTLELPSVGWRHDSGGIPIVLREGGRLIASTRKDWPGTWVVTSAYQGFLFNVGPRVARYVEAAARLEQHLASWSKQAKAAPQAA